MNNEATPQQRKAAAIEAIRSVVHSPKREHSETNDIIIASCHIIMDAHKEFLKKTKNDHGLSVGYVSEKLSALRQFACHVAGSASVPNFSDEKAKDNYTQYSYMVEGWFFE
ncbi:hypothetical protein [Oceanicaulis alexandrii]|uniref:hypothetical protein n=1 Tax=Oceanicaulis alexandrii TaxID=153233 RepID=UPI003B509351